MMRDESLERRLSAHSWGGGSELWGPRHDYREALLMRMMPPLPTAPRVLNAGCGAGTMTLRLLRSGYSVTSLDSSQEFVKGLGAQLAEGHPGVESPVLLGDVGAMPFEADTFDVVVCAEVLEHLDDDLGAVHEIARVLRPGGTLVGSVPANPWRFDWTDHWAGHRRRYTREGLDALLSHAGLDQVRTTAWGFPLTGLYHRLVYRRVLRRRLESSGPAAPAAGARSRWLQRLARSAFELDSLFLGRRAGYLGFLLSAHKPRSPAA